MCEKLSWQHRWGDTGVGPARAQGLSLGSGRGSRKPWVSVGVATCLPWPVSSPLLGDLTSFKADQTLGSFLGAFRRLWLDVGGAGAGTLMGTLPLLASVLACLEGVCLIAHCDPKYCSLPESYVYRILQARILEWVATSYSRGSSRPRGQTHVSCVSCIGRWVLYLLSHWEALASQERGIDKCIISSLENNNFQIFS